MFKTIINTKKGVFEEYVKDKMGFGKDLSMEDWDNLVNDIERNIAFPIQDPFDLNYIPSRNFKWNIKPGKIDQLEIIS